MQARRQPYQVPDMSIEGKLTIRLNTYSGCVNRVHIDSSRPVYAARMFQGKSIHEVQKTLPLLFSICGTAQAYAGVRAIEQARGVQVKAATDAVRDSLVHMETLREHLWQILLDWPAFLGELPIKGGMAKLISLQSEFRRVITGGGEAFVDSARLDYPGNLDLLQSLVAEIALVLEQQVFNMPPVEWLGIDSLQAINDWAGSNDSVACRLLNFVQGSGWGGIGDSLVVSLPDLAEDQIHRLMENDEFAARPQWLDQCCESTCHTRTQSPLLALLVPQYGNGLLPRMLSRLTEMAQLSLELLPEPSETGINDVESDVVSVQNPGLGQVEAARGRLLHRIQLNGERIRRYQIVAPTEWNFHPQGVVAQSLKTLSGDNEQIEQQARLLINAIDPCVEYQLSVN